MMTVRKLSFAILSVVAVPAMLHAQGGPPGGAPGGRGGEPPKNLQVLPKDFSRQQVLGVMNSFTTALGVNCAYCHAVDTTVAPVAGRPPALDQASDAKETKKVAREMFKMVMAINNTYLPATGRTTPDRFKVNCETCHHGLNRPQSLRAAMADAVEAKGADSATTLYKALRAKYYGGAAYDFGENTLNLAAQEIARLKDQRPAAIRLAQLNLEYYDKSAPTYQTIANLNLAAGDTVAAVAAITKAIALQPTNPQYQQMLQRIQPKPPSY